MPGFESMIEEASKKSGFGAKVGEAAADAMGWMGQKASAVKTAMTGAANATTPYNAGKLASTAIKKLPEGTGALMGVDLGARAVTAGVNNMFGSGDDNTEAIQKQLQTDPLAQFLPSWLDQAARGGEAAGNFLGDLVMEGKLEGSRTRAMRDRDLKMLGLDDAAMAKNGQLDPATLALLAARKAKLAVPAEEDIMPAHTTGGAAGQFAQSQAAGATELSDRLLSAARNGGTRTLDEESSLTGQMGLYHMMAGHATAQQAADAALQHNVTTERGQDMSFMPHMFEIQRQKAINQAIATGNLPKANAIASIGKPAEPVHTSVLPESIVAGTAPTLAVVQGNKVSMHTAPTADELKRRAIREREAAKVATATTGVRG